MSKYVQAQKLNRRVTIQRKVLVQDSWGQPTDDWVDVATVWASALMQTGMGFVNQERFAGGTEISRTHGSIRIRWREGIEAGMRVLYGDQIYDIRVVLPDLENKRHVDLGVAIGANNG